MNLYKITLMAVLMATPAVWAQEGRRKGPRPGGPQAEGRQRGAQNRDMQWMRGLRQLDLNEDQKKQLQEIMSGHRQEVEAFREKNKDAFETIREKMKTARENKDREAFASIREEMQKLHEGAPSPEGIREKVMALLDDDQKKALKENASGSDRHPLFEGIELSDAQRKQIQPIFAAHQQATQTYFASQREKLETIRKEARGSDDPEARKAVAEKMKAIREGAPSFETVAEKIRAVLTADQIPTFNENLKKVQAQRQARAKQGGRPGPFKGNRTGPKGQDRPHPGGPRPQQS